jgi:hypothetical protein
MGRNCNIKPIVFAMATDRPSNGAKNLNSNGIFKYFVFLRRLIEFHSRNRSSRFTIVSCSASSLLFAPPKSFTVSKRAHNQFHGRLDLAYRGDAASGMRSQAMALFDPADPIFKVLWERRSDLKFWLRPIFGVNAILGGNIDGTILVAASEKASDAEKADDTEKETTAEAAAPVTAPAARAEDPTKKKKAAANRSVYNWNEAGLREAKKFISHVLHP